MEIRFHLDEHVDHDVARGLRNRGVEVTTATDAGLLSATDEEHSAFALREGRVIFTHDPDFLVIHRRGVEHAGIAYCASGARSIGEVVRYLCLMHDCMTSEEMRGRVEYI
ncbi:MAG: DUF5615 family PIN-like protein [Pirellulales bacterium]